MKTYNLTITIPIKLNFEDQDIKEKDFIKSLIKIYKEDPKELIDSITYDLIDKKKDFNVIIKKTINN